MSLIKIRNGVFETNSSSVHTLSISKENIDNEFAVNTSNINITVGEEAYNWGPDILTKWYEKADYLGINISFDIFNKYETSFYNSNKNLIQIKKELLVKTLKKKFPNSNIIFSCEGYIDHQSHDEIWFDEILDSGDPEKTLHNIIFNKNYKINIGNDNE